MPVNNCHFNVVLVKTAILLGHYILWCVSLPAYLCVNPQVLCRPTGYIRARAGELELYVGHLPVHPVQKQHLGYVYTIFERLLA